MKTPLTLYGLLNIDTNALRSSLGVAVHSSAGVPFLYRDEKTAREAFNQLWEHQQSIHVIVELQLGLVRTISK